MSFNLDRYLDGSRVMETHIYKPGSYPFDLIAPITIMWKPTCLSSDPPTDSGPQDMDVVSQPSGGPSTSSRKRKRKSQNKEKEPHPDLDTLRTVWILSHPVVFKDIFQALETATSLTLDEVSKRGEKKVEIELADLRGQVNVFEIMGPKSSQVIKGAMSPVGEDKREAFKKV
jgi:ribonuclease P/MRP protein subunit POP1